MLIQQETNTVYRSYDSVEQLIETATGIPIRDSQVSLKDSRWIGRKFANWQNVWAACRSPWPQGRKIVDQMRRDLADAALPQPKSRRRRMRFDLANGDEVDYDRLRAGQDFWRTSRRAITSDPATITLAADVGGNCNVSHQDLLWRGAAMIALVEILEAAGYRVEVWAVQCCVRLYTDSTGGMTGVCLKRAADPLDSETLTSAVSGWFFRTAIFRQFFGGEKTPRSDLGTSRLPTAKDLECLTGQTNVRLVAQAFSYRAAIETARHHLSELSGEK